MSIEPKRPASIAGHLQITMGHHPEKGWIVAAPIIANGGEVLCQSRDEAKRLRDALLEAYALGKNDLRSEISNLLRPRP